MTESEDLVGLESGGETAWLPSGLCDLLSGLYEVLLQVLTARSHVFVVAINLRFHYDLKSASRLLLICLLVNIYIPSRRYWGNSPNDESLDVRRIPLDYHPFTNLAATLCVKSWQTE